MASLVAVVSVGGVKAAAVTSGKSCTPNPSPCTLHPTPYTLHPTPLHPTPYTLHPALYNINPTPYCDVADADWLILGRGHGMLLLLLLYSRYRSLKILEPSVE